ncbi:phosphate ABC transporter substrate-binding protein PstS [Burkholderia guangdongensis]|uniref:phosphate ABC transporter substrate-binding protein PstS n=1 Tax=Burkholderia guangdongensis TaxID=1792500 RepID=UPI0031B5FBE5
MRQVLLLIAGLAGFLCSTANAGADIAGAGSTFAAPLYAKWADAYRKSGGDKVTYRAVGSTEGIKAIIANQVDFAGSDEPLTDVDLLKNGLLQFPAITGGVVPVVNIPDIRPGQLTLSGKVLGDIYLGKIVNWNAPAIAALNPGLKLPDLAIAVVRRQDGSGTTRIWTHYLAQVNADWKGTVGEGSAVHWPRGLGGLGNEGVATFVHYVPGAIGYVAWDFTKRNHLAYVAMKNAAGATVEPEPRTFQAAAASADWSGAYDQFLTNEPASDAWPVVGATYVLLRADSGKPERSDATLKFLDWIYENGNQAAIALDYIPLPAQALTEIRERLHAQVRVGSTNTNDDR